MSSVCQRSFNQMARVVSISLTLALKQFKELVVWRNSQFMQIPQVRKPLRRLHNRKMNIQIPIFLLRAPYHAHQFLDRRINLLILLPSQKVTSTLEPLRHIRVPEQVIRDRPNARLVAVRFVPFQLEGVVASCLFQDVELVEQSIGVDDFSSTTDEAWSCLQERRVAECDLWVRHL